jgi:hypothetical protein
MVRGNQRRDRIQRLIQQAMKRGREIDTIDPLIQTAKTMYPYLPNKVRMEYARTALRVIKERKIEENKMGYSQTTLLTFIPNQ